MADVLDAEKRALLHFLEYQRTSVLSIVEGLDETAWHTTIVPSVWTAAGLIEHLGGAERHWFQQVVARAAVELPWDQGRPALIRRRPSRVTGRRRTSSLITETSARAPTRRWQ